MENKQQKLFFHMGLPKTASTYLQKLVFPNLKGLQYFRKRKFKHFVELTKESTSDKLLFTTESDRGLDKKLDRIAAHFPDARIILVFRRQDKWIASKYKYYIRKHGHLKFNAFFDLAKDTGLWKKEELYFQKYIDLVKERFVQAPLILTQEQLKEDPHIFLKKITAFIEVDFPGASIQHKIINKAFSEKQLILLRKFNAAYPYQELKTKIRFINKIHYKYREFLLHIMAFLLGFLPKTIAKGETLISPAALDEIKRYYQEDWTKVENLCK